MEHETPSQDIAVEVISDVQRWEAIRKDWDALIIDSPRASTFLEYDWLREWWRFYGDRYGEGGLRIVITWRGDRLVGIMPLYLTGRSEWWNPRELRFISTGENVAEETCPDYMDILCATNEEDACVRAAWVAVRELQWDRIVLLDMLVTSPLLHWAEWGGVRAEVIPRGSCPVADLREGFEVFLSALSAKPRQHARQYIRAVEKSGVVFELANEGNAALFFNDLIRLHQERWMAEGEAGCFSAARFTQFHRHIVATWLPKGRVVLARLSYQGDVYAVIYGFVTKGKFDFYQSGVRRIQNGPFESPGTTANLLLMKALSERGITAYDFLRGSSPYKKRLATVEQPLAGLTIWQRGVRASLFRVGHVSRRAVWKALRAVRKVSGMR